MSKTTVCIQTNEVHEPDEHVQLLAQHGHLVH